MHRVNRTANPGFLLLLAGNGVSAFGNSLFLVGLMLYFSIDLVSPVLLGAAQAAAFLPVLLLGYTGGAAADRFSRPRLMAFADIVRGAALVTAALLLPAAERRGAGSTALLLLTLVSLMGAMQAFFQPAVVTLVSSMQHSEKAGRDLLSLRTASNHLASLAGQGLGGVLLLSLGFSFLTLLNGAGFLLSGISEFFIPEPRPNTREHIVTNRKRSGAPGGVLLELFRLNRAGAALDLFLLQQFIFPFLAVTLPFYLQYRLSLSAEWVGYCFAAVLGGSIAAALIRGRRHSAAGHPHMIYLAGILAGGIIFGASFLGRSMAELLLLPGAFLFGIAVAVIYLHSIGFVQREGTGETGGRRHGVVEAVSNGITPSAYLLAGFVAGAMPLDSVLLYLLAGGVVAFFSLIGLFIQLRHGMRSKNPPG